MTQEQKARAYDEAIKRAKTMQEKSNGMILKKWLWGIFPELKESKEERIRNVIRGWIYARPDSFFDGGISKEEMLAWLEKQDEQKTADNLEPKFKVGDWVTNGSDCTFQIESIENGIYYNTNNCGTDIESTEKYCRLWTIADAKDGDVLTDGTTIFIFKDLLSDGSVMSYCDYDTDSGESDAFCPLSMNLMCSKITPATKEQRELLFSKMKEACYEYDDEKKELNRIKKQGKSKWTEDDEENLNDLDVILFEYKDIPKENYWHIINWVKSLKQKIVGQQ